MCGRPGEYFSEDDPELNLAPGFAPDFCCPRFFLCVTTLQLTTEFRACDPWHNAREPGPEARLTRSAGKDGISAITRDQRACDD